MFFFLNFDDNENKTKMPSVKQTMKPILTALMEHNGKAGNDELNNAVIKLLGLPEDITTIMHKGSNTRSEIDYRIAWGKTYLKKYGLITNVARGVWTITDAFDGNIDELNPDEVVLKVRNNTIRDIDNDDEKEALTGFESALAFENMVSALLKELAAREEKTVYYTYSDTSDYGYNIFLPNGLEDISQEVKCIVKYVLNPSESSIAELQRIIEQELERFSSSEHILYITNVKISKGIRDMLGANIRVWDCDDVKARIDPDEDSAQYFINPKQALIKDSVTKDVDTVDTSAREKRKEKYINKAKTAYNQQDIVLFLGAGISIDGGIPLWNTLIKTLHISMLNKLTEEKSLSS